MKKYAGIYKITCTASGATYIGSSINLKKREKEHFNDLKAKRHVNSIMQRTFDKYGLEFFKFESLIYLDPTSKDFVRNIEQRALDIYKPSMNILYKVDSMPDATKFSKPVLQYNIDGKFVAEYASIAEAERQLNFYPDDLRRVLSGDRKTIKGTMWTYKFSDEIPQTIEPLPSPDFSKREGSFRLAYWEYATYTIYQWSKEGVLVKTWTNLKELCDFFGLQRKTFTEHMSRKLKTFGGFVFTLNDPVFPS
jgi:hypothetical protein